VRRVHNDVIRNKRRSGADKTLSGTFNNSALRDLSEYANRNSSRQRRGIRVDPRDDLRIDTREDRNRCSPDGIAMGYTVLTVNHLSLRYRAILNRDHVADENEARG